MRCRGNYTKIRVQRRTSRKTRKDERKGATRERVEEKQQEKTTRRKAIKSRLPMRSLRSPTERREKDAKRTGEGVGQKTKNQRRPQRSKQKQGINASKTKNVRKSSPIVACRRAASAPIRVIKNTFKRLQGKKLRI